MQEPHADERIDPSRIHAVVDAFLILCALGMFFATIAFAVETRVPAGRFEFAPVPEIALVRGVPEIVQLGIFQLDPTNRWTPGDLTRESGWKSNHLTQLVDAATGEEVAGLSYDERTGELSYTGVWSGEAAVKLKQVAGASESLPFRIRVLRPTVVFGENAALVNEQKGWGAAICPTPERTFTWCRRNRFSGGSSDAAPLVVFFTPGVYSGQDWYFGESRRFVYFLGDPSTRPTLVGDELGGYTPEIYTVRNLNLRDASIAAGSRPNWPASMFVSNVYQCCETRNQNGIVNPNGPTREPWKVWWWSSESKGMGNPGNTVHAAYVEGRPKSEFQVNNVRFLGTKGSSAVKTTMQVLGVRHSLFSVSEVPGDPTQGGLMHTPVDVPGSSEVTIYGNDFQLWRGTTAGVPSGKSGVLAGAIFLRQRKASTGSDIPAYPTVSWDPPRTDQATASSPGGGWSAGPETFVDPAFWNEVAELPIDDPSNPYSFKHFVGFNRFVQLPTSLPVVPLRDDGTYPVEEIFQFGPGRAKRVTPNWVERSMTWMFGNEYLNYGDQQPHVDLDKASYVKEIEPGAKWPRTKPQEFPHAVELTGELPAWFGL